jgi:hypothetical protein
VPTRYLQTYAYLPLAAPAGTQATIEAVVTDIGIIP